MNESVKKSDAAGNNIDIKQRLELYKKQKARRSRLTFFLFILPALLFFVNVVIVPFISGIIYSFTNWDGFSFAGSKFIGLENYVAAFTDDSFIPSFLFSFKYALAMLILVNLIGFSLALLVSSKIKTRNVLRSIYFMPNMIGGLILGFIWQFIFSKLFVQVGEVLSAEGAFFNWIVDERMAFWSLVIVGVWQQAGYAMIIYIAGLQSISDDVKEASQIDGASWSRQLRHILLPLMVPSFTINMFLTLSKALKEYDINLALTNGGPYGTTEMVAMNVFQTAYRYNDFAEAQAKAVLFFLVIMVITLLQVNLTSRKEVSA
ncbi:MAG: maltose transport system permease protein [Clostridiales bacterium]|jgi:raffinose/stachyose/melibiose transport system permease protein|nr:maltose transport system permease protein [Clostridiales bacterium]